MNTQCFLAMTSAYSWGKTRVNILLTGGTGFLGNLLANRFIEDHHNVLVLSRSVTGKERTNPQGQSLDFLKVDDAYFSEKIISYKPDVMVNTACAYDRNGASFQNLFDANYAFPMKVLQICLESGAKFLMNAGTSLPFDFNRYTLFKHHFAEWGRFYARNGSISLLNLKLEHFYGSKAPQNNFISWVFQRLIHNEEIPLTEGKQMRDFVSVNDIVEIFSRAVGKKIQGSVEVDVGTGETPTVKEVVLYMKKITDSTSKLLFGALPSRDNEPNSQPFLPTLQSQEWRCTTTWKEGLLQMYKELTK